jgi:hypothetical protein
VRTVVLRGTLATTLFVSVAAATNAGAEPVQWTANGHFYDVVLAPGTLSWEEANTAATAAGGHLATITSAAENNFVFSLVNQPRFWNGYSGPWLGGYQDPATQQPTGNWRWVTGESWTYTNWQAGQPNDSGGKAEDKLQFGFASLVSVWNDIMSVDPTPAYRPIAFVLEWEYDPQAPTLEGRASASGLQIELCWQTAEGRFYQLLYSFALAPNQWAPLSTNWVSGDGTGHCEVDTISLGSATKFYRLLSTNAPPR